MCACGFNTQVWRYAFSLEYQRLRLEYLGPDGYIHRYGRASVWRMYEAALAELRLRVVAIAALGVFSHRCPL